MPKVKTSKTERKILKLLVSSPHDLTLYEITKRIYPNIDLTKVLARRCFVGKILKGLEKQGIVQIKNSYPRFYSLVGVWSKKQRFDTILYEIECPNCKRSHWVGDTQLTKKCMCRNKSKKGVRFWITKSRYTGGKKIV